MHSSRLYYQNDLAIVHDQGYSQLAQFAATYGANLLQSQGHRSGTVVELGCGSGYFAHSISQEGYQVIGIDYSAALIDLAKRRAPQTTFICASFLDYTLPKCTAIVAIDEVFNYAFDDRNSLEALEAFFAHCYAQLLPQGFLLFDVLEPNQLDGAQHKQKIVDHSDWTMYIEYTEDLEQQYYQRDIHLFRKLENGLYRKSREVHPVRLFARTDLQHLLTTLGFTVSLLKRYGDAPPFEDKKIGILAVK